MLKVGIVGLGGISKVHISGWQNIDGAEIVAVCDIREEKFEGKEFARCYKSYDEMLEKETFDIIDVCVPTYLHIEYSLKALNEGINVICEKPLTLNKKEVKKVYAAAEKNNVKFMVAQVTRFMVPYAYIKKAVESNKYGKILSGTMSRIGCCKMYPRKWTQNYQGPHNVDTYFRDDQGVYPNLWTPTSGIETPVCGHQHQESRPQVVDTNIPENHHSF